MPFEERQEESAAERMFVIGGSGLAIAGMFQKSTGKSLLYLLGGGVLVLKGLAERNNLKRRYDPDNMSKRKQPTVHKGIRVEHSVEIAKTPHEVYLLWRNVENLPKFMNHLISVRDTGDGQSLWQVHAPFDNQVSWEAKITEDIAGERISWRSLPGALVQNQGVVRFIDAPGGACSVHLLLEYNPPLGSLGVKFAQIMGEDPEQQLLEDLNRFKRLAESGQLPSVVSAKPVQP